jgi:diacylglycerol kinase family enzyme
MILLTKDRSPRAARRALDFDARDLNASPRFAAVVNLGAFGRGERSRLERHFVRELGLSPADISYADPHALRDAFHRAAARGASVVLAYGGDGTARTAIEELSPLGVAVAPLPGGTLNRLSRRVFGASPLGAIIRGVANGRGEWIEGGRIGRRRFFVAAGFGAMMRLGGLREHIRKGDLRAALQRWFAMQGTLFAEPIEIGRFGRETDCVIVGVGPVDAAFGLKPEAPREAFEVASAQFGSLWGAAALAPFALLGGWRSLRGVVAGKARCVHLRGREGIPALLDGEPATLGAETVLHFEERCGLVWRAG